MRTTVPADEKPSQGACSALFTCPLKDQKGQIRAFMVMLKTPEGAIVPVSVASAELASV
jgi:hypothetical protein